MKGGDGKLKACPTRHQEAQGLFPRKSGNCPPAGIQNDIGMSTIIFRAGSCEACAEQIYRFVSFLTNMNVPTTRKAANNPTITARLKIGPARITFAYSDLPA